MGHVVMGTRKHDVRHYTALHGMERGGKRGVRTREWRGREH